MTGRPNGPGWATWCGLAVVAAAAAVLSFSALADLAVMCGVPVTLAPLLPVAIDAGAGVACTVWLSRRANEAATRYAAWTTWSLLAATVAGNALHSGLIAADVRPAWWVAVAVGAVPPAVLGSVTHLATLARRTDLSGRPVTAVLPSTAGAEGAGTTRTPSAVVGHGPTTDLDRSVPGAGSETARTLAAHQGYSLVSTPAPGTSPVQVGPDAGPIPGSTSGVSEDERAAALIAEGAGRRRLARELGVTEHQARELLAERRNGHEVVAR